jgi:beta-fructofuranosidase
MEDKKPKAASSWPRLTPATPQYPRPPQSQPKFKPPTQSPPPLNRQPPGLKKPRPESPLVTPAISRAMFHMKAATPRAESDPFRPLYHFHAPAQWMGGPSATLFHEGWCHLFYQFDPYSDVWGTIHWGHAHSRDMVHWEHMPIALYPSDDRGEEHCFSGSAIFSVERKPMLFYASIHKGKDPKDYSEVCAATGDSQLMVWKKFQGNPVVPFNAAGGLNVTEWRDPCIFREAERTFMATGCKLHENDGGDAAVLLHEAENKDLTRWQYKGVLFRHPRKDAKSIESPNLFKIGEKHVLIAGPSGPVEYHVGRFDVNTLSFIPEKSGVIDASDNFHATNVVEDGLQRHILLGSIQGFKPNRGWNGCMSLPRVLSVAPDGSLLQEPLPQLHRLRSNYVKVPSFPLSRATQILQDIRGDSLEIVVEMEPHAARACGIRVRRSFDGIGGISIRFQDDVLDVAGAITPLNLKDNGGKLVLHAFLDRSVLEVFANKRTCGTRVIYAAANDLGVEVFAEGGEINVISIDAWTMRRPV